jgi:hypothetical protein
VEQVSTVTAVAPLLTLPAALVAALATALLLARYRRAVLRLMALRPPGAVVPGVHAGQAVAAAGRPAPGAGVALPALLTSRRRRHLGIAVAVGPVVGLLYTVMSLAWNDIGLGPRRVLVVALVLSWPAVPAVWVASDGDRRPTAAVAGVLLAAPLLAAVLTGNDAADLLLYWVNQNAVVTLAVVLLLARAFRPVGVPLLGVVMLASVGALVALGLLTVPAVRNLVVVVALAGGVEVAGPFAGVLVLVLTGTVGLLAAGLAAWAGFGAAGRWYGRGAFSDHMLLLGAVCFVFCLEYTAVAAPGSLVVLSVGLALFAAVVTGALLASRLLVPAVPAAARLLVLRVFGDSRRSVPLLDAVAARWRFAGPVSLIGGPDLARSQVEPDEFLTFAAGRLHTLFVTASQDVAERAAALGRPPRADPDGRFRVEEWFCVDTTWQPSVDVLLAASDVVLLDLRGFTAARQGALYELDLLVRADALDRTVLVVDATTDEPLVAAVLAAARDRPVLVRTGPGNGPRDVVEALAACARGGSYSGAGEHDAS